MYSANYRCNDGILTAVKALFQQAKTYRWQIMLAIKKKIQATYQQDMFGFFWSIAMPIIPMTLYMFLAMVKVFKTVDNMPFVYYIGAGMLVWLLMSMTIYTIVTSIKSEKSILTTTNFPIFPTMLSRLGEVLHESSIRLIVLIFIVIWYQIDVTFFSLLLTLLSLIPVILFALGAGMMLGILDVVVQDTRRVVLLILRYGLFVSSVIFPFPDTGIIAEINKFNIFNTFVNATRDLLFQGYIEDLELYIYSSIAGFIIFLLAAKMVYTMDYKVRAYL